MEFGADAPALYYQVSESEREQRCDLNNDLCIIDEEHFFIRGSLELVVVDNDENFAWGVWCSLSKDSLKRCYEIWNKKGREAEPPFFGWLSTALPLYPNTLSLKANVHTRSVGQRPYVELQPTDHPLSVEQQKGITIERVQEIAEALLHPKDTA